MSSLEPIDCAQKHTGVVTAHTLLQLVRKATDSLYMHGRAVHDRASYSNAFIFDMSATEKSGRVETAHKLDLPGEVSNGNTSARTLRKSSDGVFGDYMNYTETFRPERGFWSLGLCGRDRLIDVLELLPRDAEVSFRVELDANTNEYHVRATCAMNRETVEGLHGDRLVLHVESTVRGKRKVRSYIIDTSTGAHNTARFGVSR
jgi:hypothetical protein